MFRFNVAKAPEAEEISRLVNSVFRGETGMRSWTGEAHLLGGNRVDTEHIFDLIAEENSVVIVARNLEALPIVGCFHLKKHPGFGYLAMVTVDVDQQRSGLGTALLVEAERYAREELHVNEMRMTVFSVRTELLDWYRRRGYFPTGERVPFSDDRRFGEPKRDDLEFLVLSKKLGHST